MWKSNTDLICWSAAFFQFYSFLHFCVTNSLGFSCLRMSRSLSFPCNFIIIIFAFYLLNIWNCFSNVARLFVYFLIVELKRMQKKPIRNNEFHVL